MQPVAPLTTGHLAAGEFIDDDNDLNRLTGVVILAALHDVIHIAFVEVMRLQRVVDQVRPLHVAGRIKTFQPRQLLRVPDTFVGQMAGVLFFFDLEVLVPLQLPSDPVGLGILADVVGCRSGDDQRRAGLVDQNVVDLVNDGEIEPPLHLQVAPRFHVVAEIVEAEFVVRAVGNVAGVGRLPLVWRHRGLNRSDRQAESEM